MSPRIPGPPASDSAKFLGLIARVTTAQAGRGVSNRFRQCRRGVAEDWAGIDRDGLDVAVHEYDGPLGRGYEVECIAVDVAETWRRVAHFGPETRRETPWTEVS